MLGYRRVASCVLAVGLAGGVIVTSGCAARRASADVTAARAPTADADATLAARVTSMLASAADVEAERLSVVATDGVVTVTGQVRSGFEQQSVGAIVRAVPGVTDVRFALEVDDPEARP